MNDNDEEIVEDKCAETVEPEKSEFEISDGVLVKYGGNGGKVGIPSIVTSIGAHAFEYLYSVLGVIIPHGVTGIGGNAFFGCKRLAIVTIPETVTSIGAWAFSNCDCLTVIMYGGTKSEWEAIKKDPLWDYGTNKYTVTGKDGVIV